MNSPLRTSLTQRIIALLGTVRVRATIAVVVLVGLGLIAGAVTMVLILRHTLTDETRADAVTRAESIVKSIERNDKIPQLPVAVADEEVIQVINTSNKVVASSSNIAGRPTLATVEPGESTVITSPFGDDQFVYVAVSTSDQRYTVVVGRALVEAFESARLVKILLAIGLPILLVLIAIVTWLTVGRVLAPVEAIRSEVDGISATALDRRVPQPSGRDEIAKLARTMNRMLRRLEHAQYTQRRFISDASHELRSPVASIRQHAEVALAHPQRTSVAELAQTVLAENLRVQRLVEDLLLLAKVDEHSVVVHRQPVDVDDLVFDEASHLRNTTSLRIDTKAVSAGRIAGDQPCLQRALRNLADNASRHANSRVAFTLADHGDTIRLTIEDDGPGIPAADRERVFERFVRLDAARTRNDGGSGLGLAIVAELIHAHNGSVDISDSPLGGAKITIVLPSVHR